MRWVAALALAPHPDYSFRNRFSFVQLATCFDMEMTAFWDPPLASNDCTWTFRFGRWACIGPTTFPPMWASFGSKHLPPHCMPSRPFDLKRMRMDHPRRHWSAHVWRSEAIPAPGNAGSAVATADYSVAGNCNRIWGHAISMTELAHDRHTLD